MLARKYGYEKMQYNWGRYLLEQQQKPLRGLIKP